MNGKRLVLFVLALGLLLVTGVIPDAPITFAVTGVYNETIRVVSSAGTVLNGTASGTTAAYNETVRIVDSNGNVIDSFGSGGGTTITSGAGDLSATSQTGAVLTSNVSMGNWSSPTVTAGAVTCNFATASTCFFDITAANTTLTVTNLPSPGWINFIITASTQHTITFPSNTYYAPGVSGGASNANPFGTFSVFSSIPIALQFFCNTSGKCGEIAGAPISVPIVTAAIAASGNITSSSSTITSTTGTIGPNAGGVLQSYGGTLPTCACTGGSPTCTAQTGASNTAGELDVTGGTAMTTCTLTFSASGTFHAAPICQFTDKNASITPLVYSTGAESTSTVVFDFASSTAFNVNYICIGH